MQGFNATFKFDGFEVEKQMMELNELLSVNFIDGIPHALVGKLAELGKDVILTDCSSTLLADSTVEVVQRFRLGASFENLRAAILAGEFDVHTSSAKRTL
jgi:hypothetical protein